MQITVPTVVTDDGQKLIEIQKERGQENSWGGSNYKQFINSELHLTEHSEYGEYFLLNLFLC